MHSLKIFGRLVAVGVGLFPANAVAGEVEDYSGLGLSLPYGFYNEQFGFAAGWVEGRIGYPQPQATMLGTAIIGSEGSAMGFLMAQDLQIPGVDRLFIEAPQAPCACWQPLGPWWLGGV